MPTAPDFTDAELHQIRERLVQRYQKDVEIHLADRDLIIKSDNAQTIRCPTVFWYQGGANFVIFKTGASEYRAQFYYTPHEQFDADINAYDNLDECVIGVLQVQSNHERDSEELSPENT